MDDAFDLFLKEKIMDFLRRSAQGRDHAITRDHVLAYVSPFLIGRDISDHDRYVRRLYATLPVCTTAHGWPKGMFLPRTAEEIAEYRRELFTHMAAPLAEKRYQIVAKEYANLLRPATVAVQGNLFEEGRV